MRHALAILAAAALAAPASAQIIVDGTLDAAYGAPLAVQTVQTGFGDEDGLDDANGGELDAIYATVENGRLFIAVTGNLETDSFNQLNLFIDSVDGGENTLDALNYDFSDVSSNLGGIQFATGFEADFHLFARAGDGNFEVDFADRQGGLTDGNGDVLANTGSAALSGPFGTASGATVDFATQAANGTDVVGGAIDGSPLLFALDNSNTAGVTGGDGPADQAAAAAVTTGAEFSISLSDLGLGIGDTVSIVATYGNGDNNFLSNQTLGGLPAPQGNLGADGFGNFFGDASATALDLTAVVPVSLTVVPEPTSAALVLLAAPLAFRRRRCC